nr:hypothetical protein [Propionibacteriales bacterium]
RDDDTEGHGVALANENETVERDDDTEGHGLAASNDNETVERDGLPSEPARRPKPI